MKYLTARINLDQLILDINNPRFAELYNGSENEEDVIEYLLFTESAEELVDAISNAKEFYEDRPLWVIKDGEKYLVKDGNRRCAAIKGLQNPKKFGLMQRKIEFKDLPVLIYNDLSDLDDRIRLEHNSNLFKKWGRIAKALEIFRLFKSGSSIESLIDIDSQPKDFIKLASFYKEASQIQGENFKQLVREGKGKNGGKTIIFERLFKERDICGYTFRRSTNEIEIKNKKLFENYVITITDYLIKNPDTSSREIDNYGTRTFLDKLKDYGFPLKIEVTKGIDSLLTNSPEASISNNVISDVKPNLEISNDSKVESLKNDTNVQSSKTSTASSISTSSSNITNTGSKRYSVRTKPDIKRKRMPVSLMKLINECFNIDKNNFANAKTALTRVTFECVLKYIIENTEYQANKKFSNSNYFKLAFYDKHGNKLIYTNFTNLKNKFTELITNTGFRNAFSSFNLEIPHQIIHNYHVCATPNNAEVICGNLIPLIDFMLQEEDDLLNSLDLNKL